MGRIKAFTFEETWDSRNLGLDVPDRTEAPMIFWLWCIIWNNGLDLDTVRALTRQKDFQTKSDCSSSLCSTAGAALLAGVKFAEKGKIRRSWFATLRRFFWSWTGYPDNNPCLPARIWVNRLGTSTSCLYPHFYIHYISIYLFLYFYKCVILSSHLAQFSTNLTFYVLFAFHTKDQNWPDLTHLKTKIADNIDLKAITIFARTVFCLGLRVGHRGHRAWAKDKAGHSPLTLGPVWRGGTGGGRVGEMTHITLFGMRSPQLSWNWDSPWGSLLRSTSATFPRHTSRSWKNTAVKFQNLGTISHSHPSDFES